MLRYRLKALMIAATLTIATAPAYGSTIFATGFEGPSYTLGNLTGQDGWSMFGPTTATVQSAVVKSGSQAVAVAGSGASGQSGPYRSNASSAQLIELSADIFLTDTNNNGSWQFAGLGAGLIGFIGGVNVSSVGGINLITNGFTAVGPVFTRDAWHNLSFTFDFAAQKYSFTFDGVLTASDIAFCGANATCPGASGLAYGTQIFDTFGGSHSDIGYIDNLSVTALEANAVPEPTTSVLLATGLALGLVARRRRRR
jgi:hypothetical protein